MSGVTQECVGSVLCSTCVTSSARTPPDISHPVFSSLHFQSLILNHGSTGQYPGGGQCPRNDCNDLVVYSADTTDHFQLEEEEDRRFTWSDDVSLGHLYIARYSSTVKTWY